MGVLGTCVDFEVTEKRVSETSLGQHSLYGVLQKEFGLPFEAFSWIDETLSARVAGVSYIDLVGHLLARKPYLVGVDYDYIVTTVDMRSKAGLVLAAQDFFFFLCKASQNLPFSVDDEPFFVDCLRVGGDCFVALRIHLSYVFKYLLLII